MNTSELRTTQYSKNLKCSYRSHKDSATIIDMGGLDVVAGLQPLLQLARSIDSNFGVAEMALTTKQTIPHAWTIEMG
jgi:hypothetical protein